MSWADWAAVIGAICAGIGGIITAWASLVNARHQANEECEQRVKELRAEAEQVADELHQLRMKKAAGA